MSFFVFKLIFAALALGLVVVAVLIVREVLRKRRAAAPQASPPAAAEPRTGKLTRGKAAPEPPAPPPVRKRQLKSVSALDEEEEGTPDAQPQEAQPREVAPLDAEPHVAPMPDAFSAAVLARLEQAFEQFQAGAIALPTYEALIRGEQAEVDRRLAELRATGGDAGDVLAAQEAVRYCLDWADEQREPRSA